MRSVTRRGKANYQRANRALHSKSTPAPLHEFERQCSACSQWKAWRNKLSNAMSKTREAAHRCRRQAPNKTLRLQKSEPRNRGNDLYARPMTPGVQHTPGINLRPLLSSMRPDCSFGFFKTKICLTRVRVVSPTAAG